MDRSDQAESAVTTPGDNRWNHDPYVWFLFTVAILWAAFLSQGLPYWDADFSDYFSVTEHRSFLTLLIGLISPIPTGPDIWGLLDRFVQFLVYKISFAIAGYDSWPYLVFRCVCYGCMGSLLYLWALRLVPMTSKGRLAAIAATIFFLLAPGPVGSLIWLGDIAVTAEALLLLLTYLIWAELEKTPMSWTSLGEVPREARQHWGSRWLLLVLGVYLGYKTKADLKLIPLILAGYVILVRRSQWKLFAIPVVAMLALAVPWTPAIFRQAVPFLPRSGSTAPGFMWQPASLRHLLDFVWSPAPYSFRESYESSGTTSLAGLLGPFLLGGVVIFLGWYFGWARRSSSSTVVSVTRATPRGRALIFAFVWLAAMLAGTSALPAINPFFQIRYGILVLLPASLLLAWVFGLFTEASARIPVVAVAVAFALLLIQGSVNISRSLHHRLELGDVMIVVDRAYSYINTAFPDQDLAYLGGFKTYVYRSDAAPVLKNRDAVSSLTDLASRHIPGRTLLLSWEPLSSAQLVPIREFNGCGDGLLFDRVMPCIPGKVAYLARYIGPVSAPPSPQALAVKTYMSLSFQACQKTDYTECISIARKVLSLKPDSADAYNNIATGYAGLRRWGEAVSAAREALRIAPTNQLARNNLAWVEAEQAKAVAAKK